MSEDLKTLFREGAMEHLGELEEAILKLGESPADTAEIARLFRVMHTLKGSAAMVGLDDVSEFAHKLESEFDLIRQGKSEFCPAMLDIALLARDQMLSMIDAHFGGPPADPACTKKLIDEIRSHHKAGPSLAAQATQELLTKRVAELPELMRSPEAQNQASEALDQVMALTKEAHIQCLEEFLREFQEDFAEAAHLGRVFPPEAFLIAESAGLEAVKMLADTLAPPSDDIDPMSVMEALERPLSIKSAWNGIRPKFSQIPGTLRMFRILVSCPNGQIPSGISVEQMLDKLKSLGQIRLIHRCQPEAPTPAVVPPETQEMVKGEAA